MGKGGLKFKEFRVEFGRRVRSLRFTSIKQERIIFDNRTQMNADNQDFKFNLILALNRKLNVRHLIL